MKGPQDRKRGLTMVIYGHSLTVAQIKIGVIPFEGVTSGLVLWEEDLRSEESDLEVLEEVSITFDD
jgi:hypothetical protein